MRSPNAQKIRPIKTLLFLAALTPLIRLVWLALTDRLGANPIEFIERSTGLWTLIILLVTLSMTPIRLITGLIWQIQLRRMLGLFMFFYACLHISVYLWLDHSFDWIEIIKDIFKHPYVLVGFAAFVLTIPLALSSNNRMIKKLGGRWKTLHQLVYVIAVLAVIHFWWLVKKDITEPLLYASVLFCLLGLRLAYRFLSYLKRKEQAG